MTNSATCSILRRYKTNRSQVRTADREIHLCRRTKTWKISAMRRSLVSLVFAAALLLEYNALSAALPMGQIEDGSMEQDAFTSLLSDEAAENGLADADLISLTKPRASREIVVAVDPSLWRDLRVLQNGPSLYKRRAEDHRDAGQQPNIPILRRDTMRCMVGRVYRPCWEV